MDTMKEAIHHFRELIKLDTTNEKASEDEAAQYLKGILETESISTQIIYSPGGRANLISKLSGEGNKKNPLVLLSHLDVVAAKENDWKYPPFSGAIEEGCIWGRGTLDTKQLTVMQLISFLRLNRLSKSLNRDVYFIATSDEENGSREGMGFIAERFSDIFQDSIVLSEGGGFTIQCEDGKVIMLYASGEKGIARVKITAAGEGGHAGSPPENQAVVSLASALEALFNKDLPNGIYPILNQYSSITSKEMFVDNNQGQLLRKLYDYMKSTTVMPELISIGDQLNVIPYKAEAILEFRLPPNDSLEQFKHSLGNWLTPYSVEWELLFFQKGYESDPNDKLIQTFINISTNLGVKTEWVPFTALGKTDGRFIGNIASNIYGLSPTLTLFTDVLNRVHNIDERIELESFEYGVRLMCNVLEDFCSSNGG